MRRHLPRLAGIAQLVERLLAMQKVAGSSPVARSSHAIRDIPRRPRSQVVRRRSAKPLCGGSNPPGASTQSLLTLHILIVVTTRVRVSKK